MRMHIELDDALIARIDKVAGPRARSRFVREAIERALDRTNRWDLIESSFGVISTKGHPWDEDPSEWVHRERFSDPRRVG